MSNKAKKYIRSTSPENFKSIRTLKSINPTETDARPAYIGRHSDKRSFIRNSKEEITPESIVIIDKLMNVKIKHLLSCFK